MDCKKTSSHKISEQEKYTQKTISIYTAPSKGQLYTLCLPAYSILDLAGVQLVLARRFDVVDDDVDTDAVVVVVVVQPRDVETVKGVNQLITMKS